MEKNMDIFIDSRVLASIVSAYSYVSQAKSSSNQNITPNIMQDNNIKDKKSRERTE